ncbi:MAG TPA: Gfo/Idh/MocA family oxidoreductase [Thermoanaerobaculia bacterium]|nr:Gfo/Idh/MocA family oxidoreductase [Thermoanaerobaculia bacterium]
MLRGALIGVGHVARNGHLPGWREVPDLTFVAAADARTEGAGAFRSAYPEARWYESAEELLAGESPDFVDVCTPPAGHAPIVRAALEAGCHALCEKPLVLSAEELPGLADLARRKDRALVTVHNWKHAPALAKMTELLREGSLGRVRRVRWETLRTQPAVAAGESGNWRVDPAQSGGGVLMDHGWHALYVLRQWLGGQPRAVSARLETRRHREFQIEDTAAVSLDWDGVEAGISLTWAADERRNRVGIDGDRGGLNLDGGRLELSLDGAAPIVWELPSLAEGSHHPDWFRGVAGEFLEEVRDPAVRGRNLAEAALCVRLIAAAKESSRRGGASLPVVSA